jgi:predicted esterase
MTTRQPTSHCDNEKEIGRDPARLTAQFRHATSPMEQFLTGSLRRHFDFELPAKATHRKRWPLLIALHGYQGDKTSMMRVARRIADGRMVVISLQGPHQFFLRDGNDPRNFRVGFGWGTTYRMEESVKLHHHDLHSLIQLAVRKFHADSQRVFLLAFSQACSYNYRFVFTHPRAVRGAIGVCGGVPGDWDENPHYKSARTHILHIAATKDEWYSREKNLQFRRQLGQRAASLDFRFYNSPHKFPRTSIPHIRRWIEKHL